MGEITAIHNFNFVKKFRFRSIFLFARKLIQIA